jgi:ADP-heptose:LPS heptosyltransferase
MKTFRISNNQALGDIVVLSAAIRDLHDSFPEAEICVQVSHPDVFYNNPYAKVIEGKGSYCHASYCSNDSRDGSAFCHAFHKSIESHYGIQIKRCEPRPWLFPSASPRNMKLLEIEKPYIVIDAGYKTDMNAKHWGHANYQHLVDICSEYRFVQVGRSIDRHKPLDNVIDLLDKSDAHDLIWLIYNAEAVVTPVSAPLNIAGAFGKTCFCLAGGREYFSWYPYDSLYWFGIENEPCLRNSLKFDCRWYNNLCGESIADCMLAISPEAVACKIKEVLVNGNGWHENRQVDYLQHTIVASRGHEKGPEFVGFGKIGCSGQSVDCQRSKESVDRRNRCRISRSSEVRESPAGAEGKALLGRVVGKKGLPKEALEDICVKHGPKPTMQSWKRRRTSSEEPSRPHVERRAVEKLFIGALTSIADGDFLGDTITQVEAASIYADAIEPKEVFLLLKKDNALNFLWEGFIRLNKATVFEISFKDMNEKFKILNDIKKHKRYQEYEFDCYFESFRCMDRILRGGRGCDDNRSIIDIYLKGQEKPLDLHWTFSHHYFDVPKHRSENGTVLISPLEKCQNNLFFSFLYYREVIEALIDLEIPVVLNEKSCFCKDLEGPFLQRTFLPFNDLLQQAADSSVVITGNSGLLWASGITDTPCICCEAEGLHMGMYGVLKNHLSHVRYIQREPIVNELISRIRRVLCL